MAKNDDKKAAESASVFSALEGDVHADRADPTNPEPLASPEEGKPDDEKIAAAASDNEHKSDDEKVRDGEKDPSVPETVQSQEKKLEDDAKKDPNKRDSKGMFTGDVIPTTPVRNDPEDAATADPSVNNQGADRDQSLPDRHAAPDVYHREPSTYTPSGARPGQQNPVNPQGSPGANPLSTQVGARPDEISVRSQPLDGDYTKVSTEGEKNPSQRTVEANNEPLR